MWNCWHSCSLLAKCDSQASYWWTVRDHPGLTPDPGTLPPRATGEPARADDAPTPDPGQPPLPLHTITVSENKLGASLPILHRCGAEQHQICLYLLVGFC